MYCGKEEKEKKEEKGKEEQEEEEKDMEKVKEEEEEKKEKETFSRLILLRLPSFPCSNLYGMASARLSVGRRCYMPSNIERDAKVRLSTRPYLCVIVATGSRKACVSFISSCS